MEVLAPPPTDPLVRQEPPFDWYRTPDETRPRVETPSSLPDLDPDVALWPVTPVNRWPFTGAPTEGIWPRGWLGVDNTGTAYLCTVGGEPGTWTAAGSGGGGGWPTVNGTGSGNLTAQTLVGDTVGYNLIDQGTGGITLQSTNVGGGITISSVAALSVAGGGITISSAAANLILNTTTSGFITLNPAGSLNAHAGGTGAITISTTGGGATTGIALTTQATDTAGINITDQGTAGVVLASVGGGLDMLSLVGPVTLDVEGTGAIAIQTSGGGASHGITVTTQATDITGITLSDLGSSGIKLRSQGTGGVALATNGGGSTAGISLTTQATDAGGIGLTDNGAGGIHVNGSGSGSVFVTTSNAIHLDGGFLGFFGTTAVFRRTVTGALSTVADPSAKAVLTSIIAGLASTAGYGLVVDGTT